MNKFVLGIFVILAIGMADLPSTLGCNPDLVRPTTPSPVTRKPKTGHGKPNPKGGKPNPKGSEPNTRSVEARSNVFELEMEGFSICNTDGIEGLTFNEINACRVSYTYYSTLQTVPNNFCKPLFLDFRSVWGILYCILGPQLLTLMLLMTIKTET